MDKVNLQFAVFAGESGSGIKKAAKPVFKRELWQVPAEELDVITLIRFAKVMYKQLNPIVEFQIQV